MPKLDLCHFTVEDLGDMRLFITKKGRPTSDMTDIIWQKIFNQLQQKTVPYIDGKTARMKIDHSRTCVTNEWGEFEADQTTDWKRYCAFINTVLRDIRRGTIAYCFYYYQISQLLKFHKYDLRTKYDERDKQWEVWLDGKDEGNLF